MAPKPGQKLLTHSERMDKVNQAIALHRDGFTQRDIAVKLGVSQPTVCIWLNKAKAGLVMRRQDRIAAKLRAELVCCDIYERFMDASTEDKHELKRSDVWHDICFYGEWAARIAESTR